MLPYTRDVDGAGVPARDVDGAGVPARDDGAGVPARDVDGAGVPARDVGGEAVFNTEATSFTASSEVNSDSSSSSGPGPVSSAMVSITTCG